MNTIQQWFNKGCPYMEGVALYKSLPRSNKNVANILARHESKPNLLKLKYNLKQLSPEPIVIESKPVVLITKKGLKVRPKAIKKPKPTVSVTTPGTQTSPEPLHQPVYFHDLPDELRPVLLEANNLFKELCMLKVQLNEQPENSVEKCNIIQVQIHEKRKQNEVAWRKIDYFQKHRHLPPLTVSAFSKLTPAQLWKKDQYAFQNISKNEKRLERNLKELELATSVSERTKIERKIAKNEANILKYKEQQVELKALINGKD